MKKVTFRSAILVIGISLLITMPLGFLIGTGQRDYQERATQTSPPEIRSQQVNILILGVENYFDEVARLESAWFMIFFPGERQSVNLIPIYPSPNLFSQPEHHGAHPPFLINYRDFNSLYNISALTDAHMEWDYVLIMDEVAIGAMIQLAGSDNNVINEEQIRATLASRPRPWDDPVYTAEYQSGWVSFLCLHRDDLFDESNLNSLFGLVGTHIQTDITRNQLLVEWNRVIAIGFDSVDCEIIDR